MKFAVLLENSLDNLSKQRESLKTDHGLSLYIEWKGRRILFDTGPDSSFAMNAEKMGIDLSLIDMAFLSHGHSDHSGGLEEFFRQNSKAPLYLHREALIPHYSRKADGRIVPIGVDPVLLKRYENRVRFIDENQEILPGLDVFENIPENFPRPMTNHNLFMKKNGQMGPDDFRHEIVLSLEENAGIYIITGCSHTGVVNMVNLVKQKKPELPVQAVLGGFHIYSRGGKAAVTNDYLKSLTDALKALDTDFYTGHCTGEDNFRKIETSLPGKLYRMNTGCSKVL
ncbi:MBL fold metallo-hydrolase [Spirochaeta isovalerica]|uniref:7, 8-dihydropterin-6-yl-methyl-4-(Beta-D-ribofuranosyl)aminobenzene 5'-phosphate synthase n=1 Tax=Spirochaeta isovalerica TaxID=150 RepID=A0A841R930_9SPIO|nr:7,8-dihydropterin-6-yl-methyl-4-(beta-D-ribofuranosyl)aminobenzene 5'-phosphate synthase [Spirochaeta isovalerica]